MTFIHLDLTTCDFCNQKPTQEYIWIDFFTNIRISHLCNECSKRFKQLDKNNQIEVLKHKRFL